MAALALALGGVWLARRRNAAGVTSTNSSASKRLAVLPFENLGGAEDGYFADGMTDEVRSKLAGLSGLAVIASASASQYKATTKPPEQIAKELGVGYLLVAKVRWQKSGQTSRIRLTPELIEVGDRGAPTTRWQEAFEADLQDVFRVQAEIATRWHGAGSGAVSRARAPHGVQSTSRRTTPTSGPGRSRREPAHEVPWRSTSRRWPWIPALPWPGPGSPSDVPGTRRRRGGGAEAAERPGAGTKCPGAPCPRVLPLHRRTQEGREAHMRRLGLAPNPVLLLGLGARAKAWPVGRSSRTASGAGAGPSLVADRPRATAPAGMRGPLGV